MNSNPIKNLFIHKISIALSAFFLLANFYNSTAQDPVTTDTVRNSVGITDTNQTVHIVKDSIAYTIQLSSDSGYLQQELNVGDEILLKLAFGKFEKHKIIAILENRFVVDDGTTIYPYQLQRIAKLKKNHSKNLVFGSLICISGFVLWAMATSDILWGSAYESNSYLSDNLVWGGSLFIVGGVATMLARQSTFDIKNGDKILFVQHFIQ